MTTTYIESFESPIGFISIEANDSYILNIMYSKRIGKPNNLTSACIIQLKEYFDSKRISFNLPLHIDGTEFQRKVWNFCTRINYGETITYGQLAKKIDSPNSARAVGTALNKNLFPIIIPCHRILSKTGNKFKYAGGEKFKAFLLKLEIQ